MANPLILIQTNIKKIKKLTTREGKDSTTACLLDYDCVKKHFRLIAADLSMQKELDADPIAIQQIEFVGQLKNDGYESAVGIQSMFV